MDAGTDFADAGGGLEDCDGVAGEEDGYGGSEAAEAGADYEDLFGLGLGRGGGFALREGYMEMSETMGTSMRKGRK